MSRDAVVRMLLAAAACGAATAAAGELPVLAGPAFGTVYRVTLAAEIPGLSRGEMHREIEAVIARIDRAASAWRGDSDVSHFNRAAAGDWVPVADDLVAIVEAAREVHERSAGAFDVTVAPAGSGRPVGMRHIVSRASPPALVKSVAGLALDLGGIGPGYAVDAIGGRLASLGSTAHLVELGGEVRAWGEAAPGRAWRVELRAGVPAGMKGTGAPRAIDLSAGEALGTSSLRPGRSPLDPRTGRPVRGLARSVTVRARSCTEADAWAVAALVLGLEPGPDGIVRAPSGPATSAAPTAP